jgi:transcription initiation factor TFIIF subunit alpha
MNKRKTSATGSERWMMKVVANGLADYGSDMKKLEAPNGGENGNARPKGENSEEDINSDKGEEDEEEEVARKNKLGLTKKGMDDDEEGGKDLDFDLDDEIEKLVLGLQHLFPPISHKMIFALYCDSSLYT